MLFAVIEAGMLSGYYLAVMLAMVAVLWTAAECADGRPGRGRFVALAATAGAAAAALLLVVSWPYFGRPELAVGARIGGLGPAADTWAAIAGMSRLIFGVVPAALAILGLGALASGSAVARRMAAVGAVVAAAGLVLVFPSHALVDAIAATPFGFLRAEYRFGVVVGFGTALLAMAAFEAVRGWLGARAGALAAAVAALLVLATHGPSFSGRRDLIAAASVDRPLYDAVAILVSMGRGGPLLELPLVDVGGNRFGSELPLGQLETEAMVGSLRHHMPLLTGHTGYEPLHRPLLERAIDELPRRDALEEIVDMTHVRWLLFRPPETWRDRRLRERILSMPGVVGRMDLSRWTLARVELPVRRPEWYAAIAGGYRPGHTILGTPLAPIAEDDAVGEIVSLPTMFPRLDAGSRWTLPVEVRNLGRAAWPVTIPPSLRWTYGVHLVATWTRDGAEPSTQVVALRRDVPAGDTLVQDLVLGLPAEAGAYRLEVALQQAAGASFDVPGNAPLRLELPIVLPPTMSPVPEYGEAPQSRPRTERARSASPPGIRSSSTGSSSAPSRRPRRSRSPPRPRRRTRRACGVRRGDRRRPSGMNMPRGRARAARAATTASATRAPSGQPTARVEDRPSRPKT